MEYIFVILHVKLQIFLYILNTDLLHFEFHHFFYIFLMIAVLIITIPAKIYRVSSFQSSFPKSMRSKLTVNCWDSTLIVYRLPYCFFGERPTASKISEFSCDSGKSKRINQCISIRVLLWMNHCNGIFNIYWLFCACCRANHISGWLNSSVWTIVCWASRKTMEREIRLIQRLAQPNGSLFLLQKQHVVCCLVEFQVSISSQSCSDCKIERIEILKKN